VGTPDGATRTTTAAGPRAAWGAAIPTRRRDRDARRGAGDAPSVGVAVRDDIAEMIGIGRAEARSAPEGMEQRQDNRLSGRCRRERLATTRDRSAAADGVGLFSVACSRRKKKKKARSRM